MGRKYLGLCVHIKSQSGNALIFAMIFIVVASLGYVYMARTSTNQRDEAKDIYSQEAVYQVALEGLEKTKSDILETVNFFSKVEDLPGGVSLRNSLFRQYARNSDSAYNAFLNTNDPTDLTFPRRKLKDFFVDFARRSVPLRVGSSELPVGYRIDARNRSEKLLVDKIQYEVSIRCLKDETQVVDPSHPNFNERAIAYWRGDTDGCPIGLDAVGNSVVGAPVPTPSFDRSLFVRDNWSAEIFIGARGQNCGLAGSTCPGSHTIYQNWARLPKRVEVIVTARRGDISVTVREVAEIEPVVLNDYAFAWGRIPGPRPGAGVVIPSERQFNFFGSTIFGRVHLDDDGQGLPSVCPAGQWNQLTNGCNVAPQPYRVIVNAETQSLIALRPFTSRGIAIDAFQYLNGDHTIPLRVRDTSIQFLGGWSSTAPSLDVGNQIQTQLAEARSIVSGTNRRFTGTDCMFWPRSPNDPNKAHVTCNQGQDFDEDIDLGTRPATTFVFEHSVRVQQGAIRQPIAVYSNENIIFQGSAHFDMSQNGSQPNRVFLPYVSDQPDQDHPNSVMNPLEISSHGGTYQRFSDNNNSLAMWVANQNVIVDAVNGRPMTKEGDIGYPNPSVSDPVGGGVVYLEADPTAPSLMSAAQQGAPIRMSFTNQSASNVLNRGFIIDGKVQAAQSFRIMTGGTVNAPTFDIEAANNLGLLAIRGGMVTGEFPIIRQRAAPNPNLCGGVPCLQGFNSLYAPFDNRPEYLNFPGVTQVRSQSSWRSLTSEVSYGGHTFGGNIALANTSAPPSGTRTKLTRLERMQQVREVGPE